MDPGTGLTILGSAVGGAKVVEKLLGPTAEYLGNGLQAWTERRVQNVGNIFRKASERLGSKMESPGAVPPKLLKGILEEGSYCDDELAAEYLAGILASGRTEVGRDDRASTYIKLTSQLSTYEIRLHYIAYLAIHRLFHGSDLRLNFGEDLQQMHIHLPNSFIETAMEFVPPENPNEVMQHCVSGLIRNELLGIPFWGSAEHVNESGKHTFSNKWADVEDAGFVVAPTRHGIELFLWGAGCESTELSSYLSTSSRFVTPTGVAVPETASRVLNEAT